MRHFRKSIIFFLLLGLSPLLFSCSDSNPTSPSTNGKGQYEVSWIILLSHLPRKTVLKWECLFDGSVFMTYSTPDAQYSATCFMNWGKLRVTTGQHIAGIRITQQTTSPNTYKTSGNVSFKGDNKAGYKDLPEQTMSIATGQAVSFTFDIPF